MRMEKTMLLPLLLLLMCSLSTIQGKKTAPTTKSADVSSQQACEPNFYSVLSEISTSLGAQRVEIKNLEQENAALTAKLREMERQKTEMDKLKQQQQDAAKTSMQNYSKLIIREDKVTVCDNLGNVQRLICDVGVIIVQTALYGRANKETCSEGVPQHQLNNVRCSQHGTVNVLKTRCDGRRVCEINTNLVRTSDPCHGIFKYLETTYTCHPAIYSVTCERSVAHLQCDQGQVIFVYGAHYGRNDRTTCIYQRPTNQVQDVACSRPASQVAQRCNGKNSCTIKASNSVFGDPCPGTYKYLEVAYVCLYPQNV